MIQVVESSQSETVLLEMLVEGKGCLEISRFHDLETQTINETHLSAANGGETLQRSGVPVGVHPDDIQERHDLRLKVRNGVEADSPMEQGKSGR